MIHFDFKIISSETWPDFVSLMQTDAECANCWCLNHRRLPGCATGDLAKLEMQSLVDQKSVHGLLAYKDNQCIGWIAVDPMTHLIGHDRHHSGKDNEWSIHCVYIHESVRGMGLSTHMIQSAMSYAASNGAKLISAFPIPISERGKYPKSAEFSGRASTFEKLGFKAEGEPHEFYQRMEHQL